MEKILLVSPPTLDLLHQGARPGGPGLYAGLALKTLGASPRLVGPIGYMTLETVRAEKRLGLERLGYQTTGPGAVFRLDYSPQGRSVLRIHPPPPIDPGEVLKVLTSSMWDAVILSPLGGEEAGTILRLAWQHARLVVVDVQGYHRAGLVEVLEARGAYQLLHASQEEIGGLIPRGILVVTNGLDTIRVHTPQGLLEVDPVGPPLRDSTGAGDVFTGTLALGLLRGLNLGEAVRLAASTVPRLLPRIHEEVARVSTRCCPRVVLLDLDGTVIDTMGEYTREAARLISEVTGMSPGEVERLYRQTMGMSFRSQLLAAGVPRERVEEVALRFEEWKKRLLSRLTLDRSVAEAIATLRRHGLKVYISTNNECRVVEGLIPRGLVDGVLCNVPGGGMEKGRPHLEEVARREGVEPCQVVFIGDSSYDIRLYSGLGVRALRTRGLWRDHAPIWEVLRLKEECEAHKPNQGLEGEYE